MQTSSTPDSDTAEATPRSEIEIKCFDPDNPAAPCPICDGMGWIKYDVPVMHHDFGRLVRCPNATQEADAERRERLRRLGNLSAYADKRLENFNTTPSGYSSYYAASLASAHGVAVDFAKNPVGIVVFEGGTGCGKTHLATGIGNIHLEQGNPVWFMNAPDLLDHLRSTYRSDSDLAYDELFERVRTVDLLILDDLGTENPSAWAQEKLYQLIDHRYIRRMPTVITTNHRVEDMEPRLRSRLLDHSPGRSRRIIVAAPDYRTGNRAQDSLENSLNTYNQLNFSTFELDTKMLPAERDHLHRMVQAAYTYAENPSRWITFTGQYGTGKTHLAAAIANYLQEQTGNAIFVTIPDLMDHLRQTFDPRTAARFDHRFEMVRNAKYLVLDDLKSDYNSPWVKEKLFQIIDYRYVRVLPTIFTISDENFNKLEARMMSRIVDTRVNTIHQITTPPYSSRIRRK